MGFAGGTAVHITSGTAVLAFHVFYELDTKGFSRCWKGFWEIFMRHIKSPFVILGLVQEAPRLRIIRPGTNDNQDSDNNEREDQSPNRQGRKVRNSTDALGDPEAVTIPPIQDQPGLGLGAEADESPHNVNNMVLGPALLWIGWFGFNGGSALGGNLRAVSACVSTHVAACAGGTTSLLCYRSCRYHTCADYVPVWSSGIFGVVSAITVFLLKQLGQEMLADEPLYVFAIHAGGGWVGMFLTGVFADPAVVALDG
ncbi:hypothetical protein OIDMADRAFT_61688 [Oidiodendron maius Zn]|uniref:Ammonium transporter AmtB-like domain-containing protein n=1 Tax=Oidiodendron maius (strain Zn) TaxID=913774 RepID=A0A0C3GPM1_OIDMZ|nr:hypothetical protein OIDMADRAFT_61688 [Oidiodendron maius Zn]